MQYHINEKIEVNCNMMKEILDVLTESLISANIDKIETNLELDMAEVSTHIATLYDRLSEECRRRPVYKPKYGKQRDDIIHPMTPKEFGLTLPDDVWERWRPDRHR